MELTDKTLKLISDLEYLIGSQCYNPNSYDGWTGDEGCEYRYPVYFLANPEDENLTKTKWKILKAAPEFSPKSIDTIKYKFGSNHLFIGLGLRDVLEELEKRYGLDFNELETKVAE